MGKDGGLGFNSLRQGFEIFHTLSRNHRACYQDGLFRVIVEFFNVAQPTDSCVVVAHDTDNIGELAHPFYTGVRIRAVAHQVSQAPDTIHLTSGS
ncbi:MAG: hypothetical protein R6W31_14265 [Bacteroidales bacterium]